MTVEPRSDSEDAFSDIPAKRTHRQPDNKRNIEAKPTSTRTDLAGLGINTSTGTNIYVGKKITGSFLPETLRRLKDTTLDGFSIETKSKDGKETDVCPKKTTRFSQTTIETSPIAPVKNKAKTDCPIVVEESSESSVEKQKNKSSNAGHKKDKKSSHHISVDISSGYMGSLPSEDDRVSLGSGISAGVLGSGGMAKVYKIWNEQLEIFRAVKVLLPSNHQETWRRFETEAKISAKLHHPNIVEVYTIGQWHGLPFMEMEMVQGKPLTDLISRFKPLPCFVCSAVALQISRALAYAHRLEVLIYGKKYKGIIHRDLKPSNIMIDESGVVKLMDFGVARPVETGLHTINTTNLVGTMQYFSPEQINGYPIDQLSDIYSFGAVLYEMICGVNPFPQSKMVQLIQAKTKNVFKRLEDYSLTFDGRLSSVSQICLRTDKNTRYNDSAQLQEHLEEIHRSFKIGSPEDVVVSFLNDPESMYREEKERYLQSVHAVAQQPPDPPVRRVQAVNTDADTERCESSSIYDQEQGASKIRAAKESEFTNKQFDIGDQTQKCGFVVTSEKSRPENEEEFEEPKPKRKLPLLVLIILASLLVVVGIILFLRSTSGTQKSVSHIKKGSISCVSLSAPLKREV